MKNFKNKTKEGSKAEIFGKFEKEVGDKIPAWPGAAGKWVVKRIEDCGNGFKRLFCTYTTK